LDFLFFIVETPEYGAWANRQHPQNGDQQKDGFLQYIKSEYKLVCKYSAFGPDGFTQEKLASSVSLDFFHSPA